MLVELEGGLVESLVCPVEYSRKVIAACRETCDLFIGYKTTDDGRNVICGFEEE